MNKKENNTIILSIIIISYNTKEILKNCLISCYEALCNGPLRSHFEIIVVDNASTDGSVSMLQTEFPQVRLLANSKNVFFAKANNQGASIATGKYLFLLNSDTLIEKGNIEKLLTFMETAPPNIALCGPRTVNRDGSIQSFGFALSGFRERFIMCSKLYKIIPSWLGNVIFPCGIPIPGEEQKRRRVGWIAGCNMLFRKQIYCEIGGLNPDVGFYGEEVEIGFRLNKKRYQSWIVGDAEVIHLGGESTKLTIARDIKREELRMRNYMNLLALTNGIQKGIWMSRLVIAIARLKRITLRSLGKSEKSSQLSESIAYEKRLIQYLKEHQNETSRY